MNQQLMWSLLYIVALFAIFYFLFIRPQKKKDKQLKEMRDSLAVGDTVVTIGGIVATVAKIEEETIVIEFGPSRTKMPIQKWAIGSVQQKKEIQ
ncbi:MAG: preprotein translocase subunit YajC [Intestinibacter sp.]